MQKSGVTQVGWIHTHPLYDAFLSSIDVHTQYSIQKDASQAVAIVCATKKNQIGYYRLTDMGMSAVSKCSQDGFHQNCTSKQLYESIEASTGEIKNEKVTIVDLRQDNCGQPESNRTPNLLNQGSDEDETGTKQPTDIYDMDTDETPLSGTETTEEGTLTA